jgi:hypothetical protein
VPNIIWITGNDFHTWTDNSDNMLMQNLMAGIASVDKNHLQTTELNYNVIGSLDDLLLVPYTNLAGAYDYYCAYGVYPYSSKRGTKSTAPALLGRALPRR